MLTLYTIPESLYCAKTRILLRHKGLTWRELPPPGGVGAADYKAIVPSGNLPALDHDGFVLTDSEAIAEYLDEVFPDPPMLGQGAQARARVRERARFHDTRLEPQLRALFGHVAPDRHDRALFDRQADLVSQRLAQLARMLDAAPRPDLPLGLGDCGYPVTFAWIDAFAARLDLPIRWPAALAPWRAALEAQPAVADEMSDYAPHMEDWLVAKGV